MYSHSLSLFDDASFNKILFIQSVESEATKPLGAVSSHLTPIANSLEEPSSSLAQFPPSCSLSSPGLDAPSLL